MRDISPVQGSSKTCKLICISCSPGTGVLPEGVRGGNIFMRLGIIGELYVNLQIMKKYERFSYLLIVYLLGIVYFTAFRLVETWAFLSNSAEAIDMKGLFGYALYTGWRFDTLVCCYILALPLLMMLIGEFTRWRARWWYKVAHYFINVCFTITFFACAADIPYFCYFYSRLDVVSLTWGDTPGMVVSMIFGELEYVLALLAFIGVAVSWWFATRAVFRRVLDKPLLRAAAMRRYAFGMIQKSQQMLLNHTTECQ